MSDADHPTPTRKRVVDAVSGAIPNAVVRWASARGAPIARVSGKTAVGSAALRQALTTLAQPPKRLWSRSGTGSVADIANRVGREPEEVQRWHDAGMLHPPGEKAAGDKLGPGAFDRAALIDLALQSGGEEVALMRAAAEGNLVWAALESVLTSAGSMTGAEVAAAAKVSPELLERVWQPLGLPIGDLEAPVFRRRDVHALRTLDALSSVFTPDDMTEASSVVGRAMADVAAAITELFRRRLADPLLEAGGTDTDVVIRLAALRALLIPTLAPVFEVALDRHLEAAIRSEISIRMEALLEPGTGHRMMSVAFADLVGFTSTTEQMSASEVRLLAATLLRIAESVVTSHGGRIVKSIGDAVMYTTPGALAAAAAAVEIVEQVKKDPTLPPVRVGIGHGPVLAGYADYFGRTVNLASRLCSAASAGDVLLHVEDGVIGDDDWAGAGLRMEQREVTGLKGIDGPVAACEVKRA